MFYCLCRFWRVCAKAESTNTDIYMIFLTSLTSLLLISSPYALGFCSNVEQIYMFGLMSRGCSSAAVEWTVPNSRGCSCQQAGAISIETLSAILCLRWLAKSTCVWESTLFMIVFGIQPYRQGSNCVRSDNMMLCFLWHGLHIRMVR